MKEKEPRQMWYVDGNIHLFVLLKSNTFIDEKKHSKISVNEIKNKKTFLLILFLYPSFALIKLLILFKFFLYPQNYSWQRWNESLERLAMDNRRNYLPVQCARRNIKIKENQHFMFSFYILLHKSLITWNMIFSGIFLNEYKKNG